MRPRRDHLVAEPDLTIEDDPRFVTALARGLGILRAYRRGDTGLSNQELASRTSLAKATISRLTYTLSRLGYLEHSPTTGRYGLSVAALALGFTALGGFAIRDVARPLMQELADRLGCSVALGVPDRRTMVYIEHCRGHSPLQMGMEVGAHVRMVTSAMGRAYLASLNAETRDLLLDALCGDHENGAEMRTGVLGAVEQYRQTGFVTSVGEWRQEINSVGVPLVFHGSQTYALNCGGSALVLRSDMLDAVGRDMLDLAARIRNLLERAR